MAKPPIPPPTTITGISRTLMVTSLSYGTTDQNSPRSSRHVRRLTMDELSGMQSNALDDHGPNQRRVDVLATSRSEEARWIGRSRASVRRNRTVPCPRKAIQADTTLVYLRDAQ